MAHRCKPVLHGAHGEAARTVRRWMTTGRSHAFSPGRVDLCRELGVRAGPHTLMFRAEAAVTLLR